MYAAVEAPSQYLLRGGSRRLEPEQPKSFEHFYQGLGDAISPPNLGRFGEGPFARQWTLGRLGSVPRAGVFFTTQIKLTCRSFDPLEIVLARIGRGRGSFYHTARSRGPNRMHLAVDVFDGQKLALQNDHRIRPRRAGAAELPAVDALGSGKTTSLEIGGADPSSGGPRNHLTEIGGCADPLRREAILTRSEVSAGGPVPHTLAGALAQGSTWRSMFTRVRASPRSITTASSHVVHVQRSLPSSARSTVTFPARAKGHLPRAGVLLPAESASDPLPAHSIPSKSSSPRSGEAGGPFSIGGAFVRSACTWRSMFTRVRASPFSTTTASSQVAHVQRSLPSSARSAVITSLSAFATV